MRDLLKQEVLSFVEAGLGSGKRQGPQTQNVLADYSSSSSSYYYYYCCCLY
jgi:hypothetical protein